MVHAGSRYENPRTGTSLTVLELADEVFRAEREMPAGTGRAGAHLHLDFTQIFEVTKGIARIEVDGRERDIGVGDRVEIGRGTGHKDAWNPSPDPTAYVITIRPVPYFVHVFVATYGDLLRRDRLNHQDELKPLQLFGILRAGRAQSYAAKPSIRLQKLMLPLGAAVGRLVGDRPIVPPPPSR
jgi:mannose-6-phosphate isomerase-like protein (cupin superfamily)